MKRLTLESDLSENEIFDEEVTKLSEQRLEKLLEMPAAKILTMRCSKRVERLFDNGSWDYKRKLKNIVKVLCIPLSNIVKDLDIKEMLKRLLLRRWTIYVLL